MSEEQKDLKVEKGSDLQMVADKAFNDAIGDVSFLNRDQVFAARDIKREVMDVPEWGGKIAIWGMTGLQKGTFESALMATKGKSQTENWKRFRSAMLVKCCYDGLQDGANRVFRDQDIDALNEKSAAVLDRLFQKAQDLSGYTKKDVDELTKNSEEGQSDGFTFV